jgi:hypothetical protein
VTPASADVPTRCTYAAQGSSPVGTTAPTESRSGHTHTHTHTHTHIQLPACCHCPQPPWHAPGYLFVIATVGAVASSTQAHASTRHSGCMPHCTVTVQHSPHMRLLPHTRCAAPAVSVTPDTRWCEQCVGASLQQQGTNEHTKRRCTQHAAQQQTHTLLPRAAAKTTCARLQGSTSQRELEEWKDTTAAACAVAAAPLKPCPHRHTRDMHVRHVQPRATSDLSQTQRRLDGWQHTMRHGATAHTTSYTL